MQIPLIVECFIELDDIRVVYFSECPDLIDQQLHIYIDRVFIYSFDCELFTRIVDEMSSPNSPEMTASDDLPETIMLLDVIFQVKDLFDVVVFLFLTKKLKFH